MLTSTAWWLSPQAGAHSTYNGAVFKHQFSSNNRVLNKHTCCHYGTKKSHDLLSATWRIRKAGGVIWSSLKAGELGKLISWIPVWVQKPKHPGETISESGKMNISVEAKKVNSLPFCSVQGLSGLDDLMSTCIGKGDLLYSLCWLKR